MPSRKRIEVLIGGEELLEGERRVVVIDSDAVQALYDPLRFKIVRLLDKGRTAKEIAEELGRPLTSLYYHLNLLVEHGVVEVSEERIKGRTVERIFRRAADDFAADAEAANAVAKFPHAGGQLAFAIRHLHRASQCESGEEDDREGGPRCVLDAAFFASDEEVEHLVRRVQDALDENRGRRPTKTKKRRRFRAIVVIAPEGDDPPAVVIEKIERRTVDG